MSGSRTPPVTTPTGAPRGLTSAEAARRAADGRGNDTPGRTGRTLGEIVRANVLTRFNAIIGALFAVILVIGPIQDGLFGFVIVFNTAIGIVQELRARRTLARLAIVGEARPRVYRDGAVTEIGTHDVVQDDEIELGPGDQIVVDGEVLDADGLEVDESLLTGESDPVLKRPGDQVLSGSFVVAGTGSHRATRVGRDAYAARLAEEASRFTLVRSELRAGIDRILRLITWLLVPAAVLISYSQLTLHQPLPAALRGTVAALVPMVPEGLVLLTSIAFAVGVVRLGRRSCLVQELPAIEGLARVDVVCADKTGTLTENGMDLAEVRVLDPAVDPAPVLAALAAADPRPNASVQAIAARHPEPADGWRPTAIAPFSSARKWSGASFDGRGHWVLGAPDVLLTSDDPALTQAGELGARGLRVLLLARAAHPVDTPDAPGPVRPAALMVLAQRVRPDAADTIRYFERQDVAVKVVSGDNAVSVGAVAASLGLPHADTPVDARDLPADQAELAAALDRTSVLGRVTPSQKRDVVGALQARGHTVAMTGDGVNDVLALKDADIGVAMGSGSPATRAVAQIVLLDNRFATLPHVVAEGRRVIGNVERVANLFLTKTVYSVLLAVLIGAARLPFPFLPRHLTLLGWFTIGIPSFFLALAPNTERARPGFVPRVLRLALPAGVVVAVAAFTTYWLCRGLDQVASQRQASTATVFTLFLIAGWVLAVVARPYQWWKVLLLAAMALGFLAALFTGPGQRFFEFDPGHGTAMLLAGGVGAVGVALVEIGWWLDGWLHGERRRLVAGAGPNRS